jgi:hypothetical protein
MPDITLSRLREANTQLQQMVDQYGNFTQAQQEQFAKSAELEIAQIQTTLAQLRGVGGRGPIDRLL